MANLRYFIGQTLSALKRSAWSSLLTSSTICLSLLIPAFYVTTLQNLESLTLVWGRSANIVVVLADDLSQEDRSTLNQALGALPGVSKTDPVSPEEALERFKARGPKAAELVEGVSPDILPSTVEITLATGFAKLEDVQKLATQIQTMPNIEEVDYGQDEFQQLENLVSGLRYGGVGIGLLIFLGLLGTFWGLLETVGSIKNVIGNLSVSSGDISTTFNNLKSGLEAPLSGMGTAFSSSLFGLSGSLILGFLDLQASQSQNRFYNDLEEWLSSLTRLSSGALTTEGDQSVPAYLQALLEQTAENLGSLQRTLARDAESNVHNNQNLSQLAESLGNLGDQMQAEQHLLIKLAESQIDLRPVLERLETSNSRNNLNEATQTHIRNIDLYMARLLEEISMGRDDIVQQMRSEIKLLARTIAASQENNS